MARSRNAGKKPPARKSKVWIAANSALVVALVGIAGSFLVQHFNATPSPKPTPSVSRNSSAGPRVEVDAVRVQDSSDSSLVTVLLRNTGDQTAIIKSAAFTVRQDAVLPLCMSQGALDTSATYGTIVPPDPTRGTIIHTDVSQQEHPDSADKFAFRLRLSSGMIRGLSFYDMAMTLYYDNVSQPVSVGNILVSLPANPDARYVWTKTYQATHMAGTGGSPSQVAEWSKCMVQNSQAIRPMLESSAARSPSISSLQSAIAFCCVLADPTASKRN